MARHLSLATQREAQEASLLALGGQGNALFAALSGFFAAAGASPGVLFSPVSLLVGGLGAGTFCYDGRARQPGREAKRPRGFEGEVPLSARVAVPGSLWALSVACAFHPGTSLLAASRVGVSAAKSLGAKNRAWLIDVSAGLGAKFLSEPRLRKELLVQFGPPEQGNWGPPDLVASPDIQKLPVPSFENDDALTLPWQMTETQSVNLLEGEEWGRSHCIVVVDAAGLFVALSYRDLPGTVSLDEFEINMPAFAVPVLRGVPRVTPGEALLTPAELYLDRDETGAICATRAIPTPGEPGLRIVRDAGTKETFAG